jgi:flagellar hook-associated protein 1 FlgK
LVAIGSAPTVTTPVVLGTLNMSTNPPSFIGATANLTPTIAGQLPGFIAPLAGNTSGLSAGAGPPSNITISSGASLAPPYYSGTIELNPNLNLRALAVGDQFSGTANDSNAGAAMAAASLLVNRQVTFSTTGISGTQSIEQGATAMTVGIGQDLSNVNNSITELTTAGTQIQQAIAPRSEVSLDNEMGKLVTLQNLYQANARVVDVVSKLLDTLIALPT